MNAAKAIRAAAAIPVDRVSLTLDREDLDELVASLDELDWLQEEIKTVRAERDYAKRTEFRPANGHWLVEDGTYSCVGEIADLEVARVRVALQRARDEACRLIRDVTQKPGGYSHNDLAMAVLDAVARQYGEPQP